MSNQARRYSPSPAEEREDWDRYLDPRWRRRGLHAIDGHSHKQDGRDPGRRSGNDALPEASRRAHRSAEPAREPRGEASLYGRARASARAHAEARRGSLRLAGVPGGERLRSAIRTAARHWGGRRKGQVFHLLGKVRGELVLEYPWLDPDYLYYKFIRRT